MTMRIVGIKSGLAVGFAMIAWLGTVAGATTNESPTLLFSASYNAQTEKADLAKGKPESLNFTRSLQFGDVMKGVIKMGFRTLANERCDYEMTGNFDPRAGTLDMWICPVNWGFNDGRSYVFFTAEIPEKYRFLLYKPAAGTDLVLEIADLGVGGETHAVKYAAAGQWAAKEWHKATAVWNADTVKLIVDGEITTEEPQATRPKTGGYRFPAAEPGGIISINPNNYFKDQLASTPKDETMVDEVQIYDGPPAAGEILKKYTEIKKTQSGGVYRKPLITAPRSSVAVAVDGKLSAGEWDDAAKAPIRQLRGRKMLASHYADVLVKYDDKNIYFGFHAKGETNPITKIAARDGSVWVDGAFETMLHIGDDVNIQFVINSANVVFDIRNGDKGWNGIKTTAAGLDGDGWSLEVALPFKDLGIEPPKPGARWGVNFMHDWNQRKGGYAVWGQGEFNPNFLGTLVFGTEEPGLRIDPEVNSRTGRIKVQVGTSAGQPPATDQVRFVLTAEGTAAQESVKSFQGKEPVVFEVTAVSDKEQLLAVTVSDPKGADLLIYDLCFMVKPPLETVYRCWPLKKKIDVDLNFNDPDENMTASLSKGELKGQITLVTTGANQTALATIEVAPKAAQSTWELPFPKELPAGHYAIRASLKMPDGRLFDTQKPFGVPPDDFLKARDGIDHNVPDPWTPIAIKDDRLTILNREYVLGQSPFPVKMTSLGQPVLQQPVRWLVTTSEGEQEIKWDRPQLKEQFPDEVILEGQGRLGKGAIKARYTAKLEFDGQWLVTVTLEPAAGPVEIKAMRLEYAVARESADYVLAALTRPWEKDRVQLDIFNANDLSAGMFWLTGLKAGLVFFTTTDGNWVCPPEKPNVLIVRKDKRTEVTVLMIQAPVKLEKPAVYTLGMTATPTKPQPPRHWNSGDHTWVWCTAAFKYGMVLATKDPAQVKRDVEGLRKKGVRYCFQYSMPTILMGDQFDEYEQYWGPTWGIIKNDPISEGPWITFCPNSGGTEQVVWHTSKLAREFQIGIYFDCSAYGWCDNEAHGCGYTDSFGHKARTTSLLGLRGMLKRIYKVAHQNDCLTFNHNHSQFRVPAHTFTDLWLPGEQYCSAMAGKFEHFYTQVVPQTDYLVEMNPVIHGASMIFLPQYKRSANYAGDKDGARWCDDSHAWLAERLLTMLLAHDIEITGHYMCPKPGEKVVEIYRRLGIISRMDEHKPAAIFTGYWDQPKLTVDDKGLLLSYYTFPGDNRVVAILSNPGLKEAKAALKINPRDFGLKEPLVIRDEYHAEDIKDWQAKGITMPPESFRILSIQSIAR